MEEKEVRTKTKSGLILRFLTKGYVFLDYLSLEEKKKKIIRKLMNFFFLAVK